MIKFRSKQWRICFINDWYFKNYRKFWKNNFSNLIFFGKMSPDLRVIAIYDTQMNTLRTRIVSLRVRGCEHRFKKHQTCKNSVFTSYFLISIIYACDNHAHAHWFHFAEDIFAFSLHHRWKKLVIICQRYALSKWSTFSLIKKYTNIGSL